MTGNVPASQDDDPARDGTAPGQAIIPASVGTAFPRTHHVLTLEHGNRSAFDDPSQEWRRLFSELLGTFALMNPARSFGPALVR